MCVCGEGVKSPLGQRAPGLPAPALRLFCCQTNGSATQNGVCFANSCGEYGMCWGKKTVKWGVGRVVVVAGVGVACCNFNLQNHWGSKHPAKTGRFGPLEKCFSGDVLFSLHG